MIVQTDFPDHWKTLLVIRATGSETAARAVLRLWGHCQQRRRWVFPELTPVMLAAICGWEGDVQVFWDAMVGTFIDETTAGFEVHEWAQINASLIGSWENGKKGRRPAKNPAQTRGLSSGEPRANPVGTDKRRVEKNTQKLTLLRAARLTPVRSSKNRKPLGSIRTDLPNVGRKSRT